MDNIRTISSLDQLAMVQGDWDRLQSVQQCFFPDFIDLQNDLIHSRMPFRLFLAERNGNVVSLACFVINECEKIYKIGERKLFCLPLKRCDLIGSNFLGECNPELLNHCMDILDSEFGFDLVLLGEIMISGDLYKAARKIDRKYLLTSPDRKNSVRWLINLPSSFDAYLKSLGGVWRQSLRRKIRKLESELRPKLVVVTDPEQVDAFLRDGEKISRLTYQWNVGQRLCNDEATRVSFLNMARNRRLRAHIMYVNDIPVSFSRGQLVNRVYNFETPGYDPDYSKYSPGTVLLAWAIKDLIENSDCLFFDFGTGGDQTGYKARFGNVSIASRVMQISNTIRIYPLFLIGLDLCLILLKNLLNLVIGQGRLRQWMRKAIRRYGE